LGAPAGLLRADMSPKPAYERLRDLIRRGWWTRADATADVKGEVALRAFAGEYEISVSDGRGSAIKKTVTVATGSTATEIVVLLDR